LESHHLDPCELPAASFFLGTYGVAPWDTSVIVTPPTAFTPSLTATI
jgi:hypothetical protein